MSEHRVRRMPFHHAITEFESHDGFVFEERGEWVNLFGYDEQSHVASSHDSS